jgi:hypothetical protein
VVGRPPCFRSSLADVRMFGVVSRSRWGPDFQAVEKLGHARTDPTVHTWPVNLMGAFQRPHTSGVSDLQYISTSPPIVAMIKLLHDFLHCP